MKALLRYVQKSRSDRRYEELGYKVCRGALPKDQVEALAGLVQRKVIPHQGPLLRQDGQIESHRYFEGTSLILNPLLNAHLPLSEGMRDLESTLTKLITSPDLATRLRELDGATHYNIHQTLLFFAAQTTAIHLDSWTFDTSPHGFSHTLWIPLQDMEPNSGLPSVIPWPRGKVVTEAELGLQSTGSYAERYDRYHRALSNKLLADSPDIATALVRKGDFIIWSSLTPHFTLPPRSFPVERLSLQLILRPIEARWGNFIDQPRDHPTNRHIRMTNQFSYFVNERISHDFAIGGSLGVPAGPT
jgi:hypothetical protein